MAVQVDPIRPTLKAPGTKRLKLKYDEPVSNFAFKFNLRRYNQKQAWPFWEPVDYVAFGGAYAVRPPLL